MKPTRILPFVRYGATMSTPQGWYPDPAGSPGHERFWDGSQWTEEVRPIAAAPPPPQAPAEATPPPPQAQEQASPPPPGPTGSAGGQQTAGSGQISADLLSNSKFAEARSGERVIKQNSRLLKVTLGPDLLARQGAMVAYQGQLDFAFEGSGASKFVKKALTGEGVPLMRCSGQGEVFLANSAFQVHIIHLNGAGLTVNGGNILAFEPSLSWEIERIKGAAMLAGGLFNTRLDGHGWVAITTDGDPVVLQTDQPTYADTDAAVAWSSSLTTTLNRTAKAGALIGRGSGEAVQLAFSGAGFVIVQPSEGAVVPPHSH